MKSSDGADAAPPDDFQRRNGEQPRPHGKKKRRFERPPSIPEHRYPDFFCIGAQKAGTSWLDKNLRRHPQLWLPPIKELHYFNELHIRRTHIWSPRHRREKGAQLLSQYLSKRDRQTWDYRHIARLADIVAGPISDGWYGRIFALAPEDRICGEVNPDYSTLPDEGIAHVLRLSPNPRIVFSMRDPIARAWSHIRMVMRNRNISDLESMEKFAASQEQMRRADYPSIIENWRRFVPADRFQTIFLDDIEQAPNTVLERICSFLGIAFDADVFAKADVPIHAGGEMEMPPSVRSILTERLKPAYERIIALYPEIGSTWMARHYQA